MWSIRKTSESTPQVQDFHSIPDAAVAGKDEAQGKMKLEGNVDGIKILLALYLKDMEVRTLLPIFMFTLFVFSHSTFYVVFFVVYDNEEHARFWGFSSLGFGLLTAGLGARLWRFQSMHTANSQELTTLTVNGDPSTDVSATQSAYEMENMAVKGYEVARLPDQALSLSPALDGSLGGSMHLSGTAQAGVHLPALGGEAHLLSSTTAGVPGPTAAPHLLPQADYLKLLVVLLVVLQNMYECRDGKLNSELSVRYFVMFVEAFHMPALAFCSGLMDTPDSTTLKAKEVAKLLAGYFLVQALYLLMIKFMLLEERESEGYMCYFQPNFYDLTDPNNPLPKWKVVYDLLVPFKHMWYVWALAAWRVLLVMWMALKHPVTAAVLTSALIGFFDVQALGFHQVCNYFPYFVMGALAKERDYMPLAMRVLGTARAKVAAGAVLACHLAMSYYAALNRLCVDYLDMSTGYRQSRCMSGLDDMALVVAGTEGDLTPPESDYWIAAFTRLTRFPMAAVLIVAFLAILPDVDTKVSRVGERVLVPYVFHLMLLLLFRSYTGMMDNYSAMESISLAVFTLPLTYVLSVPLVHINLMKLVAPDLEATGMFR